MKKNYIFLTVAILASFFFLDAQSEVRKPETNKDGGEWTIVETYDIFGKASGLAWDGQYIYFGLYSAPGDDNLIFRFDPQTGNYEQVCAGPQESAYGLTWDGQYLWTTDHPAAYDPGIAYQFDFNGTTIYQFELPATYMGGIAWDNGYFWTAAYYDPDGHIYKVDDQGNVLKDFPTPGAQPWDVCLQDEFLWIADYYDDMLYKIDTITGALQESHESEGIKPAGVVYDGSYLWYIDGQVQTNSTLYKVDLGGAGTPEINVPVTNYDFGTVAIGDSAVWNLTVQNIGTADLSIDNLIVQSAVPIFHYMVFPQLIEPGNSLDIPLIYKPTETGSLNTVVTVQSNDPVTPEVDVVLTGEAVYAGPSIHILNTSHNFGIVRINAFTSWNIEIENIGDDILIVEEINSDNPNFIVDENIEFPVSIGVLELKEFKIWFHPEEAISYEGVLEIIHNDLPNNPSEISLEGEGVDISYPIGTVFWQYNIDVGWDNSPKAIAPIQDISGDEIDDVIVCSEDNFVRCFNGNSDGIADVFWEYEIEAGDVYQQSALFVMADVNGDGYEDVVFGTSGGDRAVTVVSGKTGQLIWKFSTNYWGDGGWVYQVQAKYDYNDDAIPDVLAAAGNDGSNTGPKRAFCLDGLTGELIWQTPTGGAAFSVIGIDDVNGDGKKDALAGATNVNETEGKVYCIDGSNGSVIWSYVVDGASVWALGQLDDINGDGVNDVVAGDFYGNYYGFDGANGDVFWSGSIGSYVLILKCEMLDDVNGDGYVDFLFGSSSSNCSVINGFDGQNIWLSALVDKAWNIDRIADISGDAINDVIVGTLFQNNYVYFLDGVNGEELESVNYGEPVDAISSIPDINGDGSMEVVAGGREGKVVCYSGGLNAWTYIPENRINKSRFLVSCTPNPFIQDIKIIINLKKNTNLDVNILSAGGKNIYSFGYKEYKEGDNLQIWDGSDQSGNKVIPGIYFLKVSNTEHSKTIKIIKQ